MPGSHFWIGIGFTAVLLGVFLAGRTVFDGTEDATPRDFRLAIIHILLAGYSASAYAYLLNVATRSARDLGVVVNPAPHIQTIIDRAGAHPWWALLLAGIAGNLGTGLITIQTTPDMANPWSWQMLNYDTRWHRGTSFAFSWWIGCSLYVIVAESARLSRLSSAIQSFDLMDLRAYQPLVRHGLTNALLVIGTASVLSLFLLESGYVSMLVGAWITSAIFTWIGLMLPLSGIRRRIKIAKGEELAWCHHALRIARDALKSGSASEHSIAEVVAYRSTIESIKNWPFDNPTLVRFALYLLIPLGSWFGGAFVERGLDLFLS
jgi:hypothetical protein